MNSDTTGLQGWQIRPTAAIEGQLANGIRGYDSTNLGAGKLYSGGLRGDLYDGFRSRPDMQAEVEDLLSANRKRDPLSSLAGKPFGRDCDFVFSGQQVCCYVEAV